jgi:hypothetical protein
MAVAAAAVAAADVNDDSQALAKEAFRLSKVLVRSAD